jgi:CHAD domain-containing protein
MTILPPYKGCYDGRVGAFYDQLAPASEYVSTAAVHEMRVCLKRLRTFFRLIGSIDPSFGADEAFVPARKLFRAAGGVRNLQVLEARAREVSTSASLELSEYYNWLKEKERGEIRRFRRACRKFDDGFFESAWKGMLPSLEAPSGTRARRHAENRLVALIKEVKTERPARSGVRRLHFLRTRAKEARYVLEILQECGLATDEGARLNERLRDVHQSLGRWHDGEIVLDSLREFRRSRTPGRLVSFKSYAEFSRLIKERKAADLAGFEAARAALRAFLGRGSGRRVLVPPPPPPAAPGSTPEAGPGPERP